MRPKAALYNKLINNKYGQRPPYTINAAAALYNNLINNKCGFNQGTKNSRNMRLFFVPCIGRPIQKFINNKCNLITCAKYMH